MSSSVTPTPCRFTVEQLTRLHAIVDEWNRVRANDRRRATPAEVIDYMLTQEEIGIEAMTASEMTEELQREDLADEKPLPIQREIASWQKADPEDFDNDTNAPIKADGSHDDGFSDGYIPGDMFVL